MTRSLRLAGSRRTCCASTWRLLLSCAAPSAPSNLPPHSLGRDAMPHTLWQNLLCLDMAAALGVTIPSAFSTWLLGAAVPAIAGLLITPLLLYKLAPPEVTAFVGRGGVVESVAHDLGLGLCAGAWA
eukprot:356140-Chlamydomonas_euryale.AAC.2